MAFVRTRNAECALDYSHHILRSEQVSPLKTRALSLAVLVEPSKLRLLTMEFCWHTLRIQSCRARSCCTLVLLRHISSCAFGKCHSLS